MIDANAIRLKACRRRGGLDQAELARLVGTTHSTISRYESGRLRPDVGTLITYELIFDIPASTLLPDTTIANRRKTLARAHALKKRYERSSGALPATKVEFIRTLCHRLDGTSP
ncbi:helix-turn-helix transcriptional regulator [Maricaulis sp.]|uniref:helix-turn-helix domain-containing protein n=1 Tax=Maricaulis sp. TaxID=1486257 RepID=UPI002611F372|nr:helix-turn-helix transcriptional regulator [Maricaulis sp.]